VCFMRQGVRLEALLRGRLLSADLPVEIQALFTYGVQGWLGDVDEEELRAPNLRWCLGDVEWNEDEDGGAIRRAMARWVAIHPDWEEMLEVRWMGQIRRWVAEGI